MSAANIILPVETIDRELDFRLVQASMIRSGNRRIFIGEPAFLHPLTLKMRGGVYVGKNVFATTFPTSLHYLEQLRERGFTLVHLDEEGGMYRGDEHAWRQALDRRLDPRCLLARDHVCTWGEFQRQHYLTREPACAQNIVATGHPRFDLCKRTYRQYFEREAESLRGRFGRFILINMNHTVANHANGWKFMFRYRQRCGTGPREVQRFVDSWSRSSERLAAMTRLVSVMHVHFTNHVVVVRPHPAEDAEFYRTLFAGLPRTHVVRAGGVVPWLLAADAIVHSGCTTALEAHLAERPLVTYLVNDDASAASSGANAFGRVCTTHDDVVVGVSEALRSPVADVGTRGTRDLPRNLIANLCQDAFQAVSEVIETAVSELQGPFSAPSASYLRPKILARKYELALRALPRELSWDRRMKYRIARQKFAGFEHAVVAEKLARVSEMTGRTLHARLISPSLIEL